MNDVTLLKTCDMCPEQYDAFINSDKIGYIRLRHGHFSCDYLPSGELGEDNIRLYDFIFENDGYKGAFDTEEEREKYLDICKEKLFEKYTELIKQDKCKSLTVEEKNLLKQELCNRLPYNIICALCGHYEATKGEDFNGFYKLTHISVDENWKDTEDYPCLCSFEHLSTPMDLSEIKLYLRPLSDMTDEEKNEYKHIAPGVVFNEGIHLPNVNQINWLNKHHFDYKGLIELNLALPAPKDLYK